MQKVQVGLPLKIPLFKLKDEQTWFFLVPLLDLPYRVYQALVIALNNTEPSPHKRMLKFVSYIRNNFKGKEFPSTLEIFSYGWGSCMLRFYQRNNFDSELEIFFDWPEKYPKLVWLHRAFEWFSETPAISGWRVSLTLFGSTTYLTNEEFFDRFHKYTLDTF